MKLETMAAMAAVTLSGFGEAKTEYLEVYRSVDTNRAMARLEQLWTCEVGQTMSCKRRAAETAVRFLKEDGFSQVESIELPTDGKTAFQDKIMPYAWEATVGRLTVTKRGNYVPNNNRNGSGSQNFDVPADYAVHPFHLVKGSTATPPGGVRAKLMTEAQFLAGEDAKGAIVMLEPQTWARGRILTPILDRGGLGFVCDVITDRYETPDCVQWVTACTETSSWTPDAETRPFVGFSVSPRVGARLRAMAQAGGCEMKAESDGRRVATTMPFVTAVVPGKRAEEVWLVAHLYEPLASDDSCGVVAAIETARRFIGPEKPEYTIRVAFGIELFGYAAYLEHVGCPLRSRVIGAINLDSIPSLPNTFNHIQLGGPATPFCGNLVIESLARALKGVPEASAFQVERMGDYFDDMFMADPTVGIPVVWTLHDFYGARYWHNSRQDFAFTDAETYRRSLAFAGTFVSRLANPSAESVPPALALAKDRLARAAQEAKCREHFQHLAEVERRQLADFGRLLGEGAVSAALGDFDACAKELEPTVKDGKIADSPWRRYAAGIVPARKTVGFPMSLANVPREERIDIPGGIIYAPLGNVVANMDGKKDLARLIREAEYERNATLSEGTVASYVRSVCFLADWGYLTVANANELDGAEVVRALGAAGVKKGDLLLVDANLNNVGHIVGGDRAVIKALREAVGPEGTVLLPAFNPSVRICGELNRSWGYRPYDPKDIGSVAVTSPLTGTFLRQEPTAARSAHYVRSWTGFGPKAEEILGGQRADGAPYGDESPLAKALAKGGKYVHIGSAPNAAEFMRFLAVRKGTCERTTAVVGVRQPDGTSRDAFVPEFPVGDAKMPLPGNVRIARARLGLSEVCAMELNAIEKAAAEAK